MASDSWAVSSSSLEAERPPAADEDWRVAAAGAGAGAGALPEREHREAERGARDPPREPQAHVHRAGFPVDLFLEQDKIEDFICAICTEVCRDAVETTCTHIFCSSCLTSALDQKLECPLDHTPLQVDQVRAAGFVRRKVLNMRVKCPHFKSGCPHVCNLSDLTAHVQSCLFALVICDLCQDGMQARDLANHAKTSCPCRQVQCEHCGFLLPCDDLNTHLSLYCQHVPLPCPNSCDAAPQPRKALQTHLDEVCALQEVRCRYAAQGCSQRLLRREVAQHMEDAKTHLDVVERHFQTAMEDLRRDMLENMRFFMQVGPKDQFLKLLSNVTLKSPVEEAELIVRGMHVYEGDAYVQERCCFSLITLCEVHNKNSDTNIAAVVQHNGIGAIISAMQTHAAVSKVQENALHVLRKMATNMDVKSFVQKGSTDCIGQILRTMQTHCHSIGIQRDAIGVLLNMAVNDSIESRIGALGGIEQILLAMDLFPNSTSLGQLAAHALFHLTFDENNKERLVAAGALKRLITALKTHSQHTNTVYYSLRAMAQLAKIDRYRDKMRRLGLVEYAKSALSQHPNHKVICVM